VIVFKALGGDSKVPYFAILTQGFPRLVTVSRAGLQVDADGGELPLAVQSRVTLNQDDALVPDLVAIETLITEALAQAA
jgi:chemosensory pili system protein ChpC